MGTPFADRIRSVLGASIAPATIAVDPAAPSPVDAGGPQHDAIPGIPGGRWCEHGGVRAYIVECTRERSWVHGHDTVGSLVDRLEAAPHAAPILAGCPLPGPLLFLDLETTGLSGGAGTCAFLVGCGWFAPDGAFLTRQFVLMRSAAEAGMLSAVARELSRAGSLVTFNGKSFDAPLLETRYLYHRLAWPAAALPHLDMLHVARRLWKRDEPLAGGSSCSLTALEQHRLGHRRHGDVPGVEIPGRYFQFVRSGDARPLTAVFEHNRLDLLSLAALTARALDLVRRGSDDASDPREALALGWMYARAGDHESARDAYRRVVAMAPASDVRISALRALAVSARRARRFDEAAAYWRQMLEQRGCPGHAAREANEALAIHHEHRVRDLVTARSFAVRSLEHGINARTSRAGEYRLNRIRRKLEQAGAATLAFAESADVRLRP